MKIEVIRHYSVPFVNNANARLIATGITFFAVCHAWVVFRAPDLAGALAILDGMYGGHGIAVYNNRDASRTSFRKCYQLAAHAGRIKHIAPSDYRPGSHLRLILEEMIREIAERILRARHDEMEEGRVSAPGH